MGNDYGLEHEFLKEFLLKVDRMGEEADLRGQRSKMEQACLDLFELFGGLTKAGFTESQAMRVIETLLKEGMHR